MDRDILDRIAAEETAETGVTAEEGPTRSRGAQYFLNASAELLDAALKKEEAYNKVPVTSALHFATNIAAIREAQVELLEDALQHTTTEADKCEFIRRAKILKLLGDILQSYPAVSTQLVAKHKIKQMKDVEEKELIYKIKLYGTDVKKCRQAFKESTIPGANTNVSTSGNAVDTDEARVYLQHTKAAEQGRRGGDPEYFKDLYKKNSRYEQDDHVGKGYEEGAFSSFQLFSGTTPTSDPEADFEKAKKVFVKAMLRYD